MLPSVKLNIRFGTIPTVSAWKFSTLLFCENGANEVPRYHEMVGMGLP